MRIFSPSKCPTVIQRKENTFHSRLLWPLKIHIFRWSKRRIVPDMKPIALERRILRHGRNSVFMPPEFYEVGHWKLCILLSSFSWPLNNLIQRSPKCPTEARMLRLDDLMILEESYFQVTKLIKSLSQNPCNFRRGFHDVPGIVFLRPRKCRFCSHR